MSHCKSCRRFSYPEENCSATAATQRDIDRHIRAKHANLPMHNCSVVGCGKKFTRRDHYIRHMEKVHMMKVNREKAGRKAVFKKTQ